MKKLLILLAIILAIISLFNSPSDTEVMQQCAIDDELNRIELAKQYALDMYLNK